MKRILFILSFLLLSLGGCTPPNSSSDQSTSETTYVLTVPDMTMRVGTSETVTYSLLPAGRAAHVDYQVLSATTENMISITDGIVTASKIGEATVKATAQNVLGSSIAFSVSEEFLVTVTPHSGVDGQYIMNGGFEDGLVNWNLSSPTDNVYHVEEEASSAHSGNNALNLWSKIGSTSGESDPLDLTISQTAYIDAAGTYLFSLFYQGNIDILNLSVWQNEALLIDKDFAGSNYWEFIADDQNDYVHYGMEVDILEAGTFTLAVNFVAAWSNNWGFIDDVSFTLGTTDDLVRPTTKVIDEYNFVNNPSVSINLDGWVSDGLDNISRGSDNGTYISLYGAEGGSYSFYQQIANLPALSYNAHFNLIGSGDYSATITEAYFYIADENGTILKKVDFVVPGYSWETITLDDLDLSGSVRIGVKIVASTKIWAGFNNFHLYSEGYEPDTPPLSSDTSIALLKVFDHVVDISNEAYNVGLSADQIGILVSNKEDVSAYINATLAPGALLSSAIYDDINHKLLLEVTAEDSTSKQYVIDVYESIEWHDVLLVNAGFETGDNTGWTFTNLDEDSIASGGKNSGSYGVLGYDNVPTPGEESTIFQTVSGFEVGDKVLLSVFISTYYNSDGAKDDKVSSIKLLIGEHAIEKNDVVAASSKFMDYTLEYTLTTNDFIDGFVKVGLSFTMKTGGWINIDDFSLQSSRLIEEEDEEPSEPEWHNVPIVNADFETGDNSGWTFTNLNENSIGSGGKYSGSYGVLGYKNVPTPGEESTMLQAVSGFEVGDKVLLSVFISTYYNSDGAKDDKVSSIKLLVGEHAVEKNDVVAASSKFMMYSLEYTLTSSDLVEGFLTIGLAFTMNDGGWINIDDFTLQSSRLIEEEIEEPTDPDWHNVPLTNADFETGDNTGWTFSNLDEDSIASGGKYSGSYGILGYDNVPTPGEESTIIQSVGGFEEGDKVLLSVWISTYYNSAGVKDDKVSSIKLLIGNETVEMDSVVASSSKFMEYTLEYALTSNDITEGSIQIGLSFTMNDGGWINIDDFSLQKYS